MDDLLSEFLTETAESLDVVDVELVKFEQEPNNDKILDNIFRLVHTIKGTCGFLGLPRLESLAHAAETLMGKYRDGAEVTQDGVSLILLSIDRIKELLGGLEETGTEPEGSDEDLISKLDEMSELGAASAAGEEAPQAEDGAQESDAAAIQVLERELKPGEVSLDDLERAFQEAPGPDDMDEPAPAPEAAPAPAPESKEEKPAEVAKTKTKAPPAPPKEGAPVKAQTIRVNVETLEQLMTMVSELVLTRNQLLEMVRRLDDSEFKVPLQRLSNVTAELQEGVMKTRMQPIGNAWQKLPRVIRDLSQELNKKIDLEMIGAETELDRQVLEQIKDPLTHMVRNSADHGLESTEERLRIGKPEVGKVTLSAYHEGGHIIIEIADDGKGLDVDKVTSKALENGLVTEAELEKMSESQIHKLIFHAGLSTAEKVTNVSGRGVGMDVVRTNIELIGGTVDLRSVRGEGTTFMIKIPLTLAIVSALIVEATDQRFAIPQLAVVELVRASKNGEHRVEMINQTPVLRLRNKLLPLIYLRDLLNLQSATPEAVEEDENGEPVLDDNVFVVVTQVGPQIFGIVVDSVFHTEEIVVKPMSSMLRDITMFSGNTILGDGSVIMIIDPNGISQKVVAETMNSNLAEENANAMSDLGSDKKMAFLVFRAGDEQPRAVPLSLVTRLEEINVADIEQSNGKDLVQYRGTLMPLVYVDENCERRTEGRQPILVFTDQNRSMGLVVDEIVDIIEDRLHVEIASEDKKSVGSAVLKGKAMELIDIGYYLQKAFSDWLETKDKIEVKDELNLLLVDDSPFFRNMLAPLLSSAGYNVTLAESAADALVLRERGVDFDIIVSDIEMPEMNGIEFAESLKGDNKWSETPIIALSSHSTPEIIERSKKAGFMDYVAKFDREGLMESLREVKQKEGKAA